MTARPLRPHQAEAMLALRSSLGRGKLSPMFQAPTGFGKTRVMAEIVNGALAKQKRVLITVPAISLVDQTVAELEAEGIWDIGVIQGNHDRTDSVANVQVASVQTLERRKMPACDVILIDEAHRWFKFFERMMAEARRAGKPVIGLSATPWTKGLARHFDDLIQVISTAELIEAGFLSKFKVYAPDHPDVESVRIVAGDYHEGDLSEVMNKPELVADIVTTWIQHGEDRPTLAFAVDRAHAKQMQLQFDAAGVPSGYIDAFTTREERAKIRHLFHGRQIKIVCNVGCMTTGIDWDVRCIILARPTKSEMLFVQIIGRGLRTADGKSDCLILDHSDTHLRLGFVTDICRDALDDGKKGFSEKRRKPEPKPRDCPHCHFVRPAKIHVCPQCEFAPERQADVEIKEGELIEFGAAKSKATQEYRNSVYGQLLEIASEKGYAPGWAFHKFKEFFRGALPPRQHPGRVEPSSEIISWVRSRQIAFAKSRKSA